MKKALESILASITLTALVPSANGNEDIPRFKEQECIHISSDNPISKNCNHHVAVAEDFADYAIMAADAYRSTTRLEWHQIQLSLRKKNKGSNLKQENNCPNPQKTNNAPQDPEEKETLAQEDQSWLEAMPHNFGQNQYFTTPIKCINYDMCTNPEKKVNNHVEEEFETSLPAFIDGWERLYDFDRSAATRGFFSFVPGLFVEVWTRDQKGTNSIFAEYAIVFRGTQEDGGTFSNLHFLNSALLIFHDQYDQAKRLFPRIREQISIREQSLNDESHPRGEPLITLVGHSLGAGLAMHVAVNHKGIHRIIGFNPSPVTGYFGKSYCDRAENLKTVQSIHFIYESSEALHTFDSRKDGEKLDPALPTIIHFHKVNLIGANALKQHAMGPMACKLAVIQRDAGLIKSIPNTGFEPNSTRDSIALENERIIRSDEDENIQDDLKRLRRKERKKSCECRHSTTPISITNDISFASSTSCAW